MTTRARKLAVSGELAALIAAVRACGAEFLDTKGAPYVRLGEPNWRESTDTRKRRATEELRVFRLLDSSTAIVIQPKRTTRLAAWARKVEQEGYVCDNRRVGDRGVIHVFFRRRTRGRRTDALLDLAADTLEGLLTGSAPSPAPSNKALQTRCAPWAGRGRGPRI
jgi:hypothetical protein